MPFHYNPMAVCSVESGDIHCGPINRCRLCPRYLCSGHMEEHLRNHHLVDGNGAALPHNGHGGRGAEVAEDRAAAAAAAAAAAEGQWRWWRQR